MRKRYKWDEWLREPRTELIRGRDYTVSQSSIWQQTRNAAAKRHINVKLIDGGDRLIIWTQHLTQV